MPGPLGGFHQYLHKIFSQGRQDLVEDLVRQDLRKILSQGPHTGTIKGEPLLQGPPQSMPQMLTRYLQDLDL